MHGLDGDREGLRLAHSMRRSVVVVRLWSDGSSGRGPPPLGLAVSGLTRGELARSQVLLMLVELLPDSEDLFEALSQDPDAHLRVGQHAHITYGASMIKVSRTRAVRVARLPTGARG